MMFLHKYTKLMHAALYPRTVVYCNRADPGRLDGPDYFGFATETAAYAKQTGQVAGATVAFDDEMTALTAFQVRLAETFVFAHEIGHFISGHLDDDENYISIVSDGSMLLFAEHPDHRREFEADEYGFELLRLSEPEMPPDVLAIVILAVFQALALLAATALPNRTPHRASVPSPSSIKHSRPTAPSTSASGSKRVQRHG